jgi:hypothetical protein
MTVIIPKNKNMVAGNYGSYTKAHQRIATKTYVFNGVTQFSLLNLSMGMSSPTNSAYLVLCGSEICCIARTNSGVYVKYIFLFFAEL